MTIAIFSHLFKLMLLALFFGVCLFVCWGFYWTFTHMQTRNNQHNLTFVNFRSIPCMHISYISLYYVKDLKLIEREREREREHKEKGGHLSYMCMTTLRSNFSHVEIKMVLYQFLSSALVLKRFKWKIIRGMNLSRAHFYKSQLYVWSWYM